MKTTTKKTNFVYGVPSERLETTLGNIEFQKGRVFWDDLEKLEELLKWLKENNY
jgi:hypothetical protein|tara:strand:+ start:100 stop:261 length:162 start_codon:yes stop_codon:yes gene_type:complete